MNEKKLISSYIDNNKLNIEQVMFDFTPYLYTIIKNKSTNFLSEDIEEIISDVFYILWKNQDKLDIDREMSAYIVGITRNLIGKKCRNISRDNNLYDFEDYLYSTGNIELQVENQDQNKIIFDELQKCKKEDREIFMNFYYYSYSIKEIAIILRISESKVKSRLHRIRKRLKKVLEKGGYSGNGK